MKRLVGVHGTREDEVDELLRQASWSTSIASWSKQLGSLSRPIRCKKVEVFYMPDREATVTDGEDSILKFEEWLATGDDRSLVDRAIQRGGLRLHLAAARLAGGARR